MVTNLILKGLSLYLIQVTIHKMMNFRKTVKFTLMKFLFFSTWSKDARILSLLLLPSSRASVHLPHLGLDEQPGVWK